MGHHIHKRNTEQRRLIKRNITTHRLPFFGLGNSDLHHDLQPRSLRLLHSPIFKTHEEARQWGEKNKFGTTYTIEKHYENVRDWLNDLIPTGEIPTPDGYRAVIWEERGMGFRQRLPMQEVEEADQKHQEERMKRWLERRSFKGNVKPWRKHYSRKRRNLSRQLCHLHLSERHDEADKLNPRRIDHGVMWDVW